MSVARDGKRVLYLVMVACVAAAWYAAVNLRDSKTGRAFFAVRGSEMAAVSLGIDVIRYKLLAFAISGGLAGIAGNLIMVDLQSATPVVFQFTKSLFFLGIAVVGGVASLGGAVGAGILFAALTEVFFRVSFLSGWLDIVTIGLLLSVILFFPGGLAAAGELVKLRWPAVRARIRERWQALMVRVRPPRTDEDERSLDATASTTEPGEGILARAVRLGGPIGTALARLRRRSARIERRSINLTALRERLSEPAELAALEMSTLPDWRTAEVTGFSLPKRRGDRRPVLEADGVTVRFGGLLAVDNVSLKVCEHEIVGLIGPNGAGKTTTFNAISGLNEPTSGAIRLFGDDITNHPVHLRAAMGMGRTFQLIQLFPQLTVFENLLVATHTANPSGAFEHVVLTNRAIRSEKEARDRVRVAVEMLGLEEVADRNVDELPFGILRQVEIARALVTESPLLMLDEPASGLDNNETDELAQLLYYLRAELGVSILLIEHDVRMVTSVTDYMYVVNRGKLLAEGTPDKVQRNPDVIAAYLGEPEPAAEAVIA